MSWSSLQNPEAPDTLCIFFIGRGLKTKFSFTLKLIVKSLLSVTNKMENGDPTGQTLLTKLVLLQVNTIEIATPMACIAGLANMIPLEP